MKIDIEKSSQRDSQLLEAVNNLGAVLAKKSSHQKSIENLVIFSELFKPKFSCKASLREATQQSAQVNDEIERVKKIKKGLEKLLKEGCSS